MELVGWFKPGDDLSFIGEGYTALEHIKIYRYPNGGFHFQVVHPILVNDTKRLKGKAEKCLKETKSVLENLANIRSMY